jgi:hypothetical protein
MNCQAKSADDLHTPLLLCSRLLLRNTVVQAELQLLPADSWPHLAAGWFLLRVPHTPTLLDIMAQSNE